MYQKITWFNDSNTLPLSWHRAKQQSLKMKKILLVSGCSWSDLEFNSIFHSDLDSSWPKWPELLADKLNMNCINLSKCGAGQEYIYYSLIEKIMSMNKDDIGLIIPGWSRAPRRDHQTVVDEKLTWKNASWDNRGDMCYFIEKTLRYYYMFQIFCERFNLPYKQVQMIELFEAPVFNEEIQMYIKNSEFHSQKIFEDDSSKSKGIVSKETALKSMINSLYFNLINEKNFIGWPVETNKWFRKLDKETKVGGYAIYNKLDQDKHFISKLDRHPNAEGQKLIAETIYKNL